MHIVTLARGLYIASIAGECEEKRGQMREKEEASLAQRRPLTEREERCPGRRCRGQMKAQMKATGKRAWEVTCPPDRVLTLARLRLGHPRQVPNT